MIVTAGNGDGKNAIIPSTTDFISGTCGIVSFDPVAAAGNEAQLYYIYPVPYVQYGGDAATRYQMYNTSDTDTSSTPNYEDARCDDQATVDLSHDVIAMETRDGFHSFSSMEAYGSSSEVAALLASFAPQTANSPTLIPFMEASSNAVHAFDTSVPADWALNGGPKEKLNIEGAPNEFVSFQVGLVNAGENDATVVDVAFSDEIAAWNCFAMGGKDVAGEDFLKNYTLRGKHVGSLWMGVQLPKDALEGDEVASTISISVGGFADPMVVDVVVNIVGDAVDDEGDSDIFKSFSRLRWLDSTIGIDESVSAPFTPVGVAKHGEDSLEISLLLKKLIINERGFPSKLTVDYKTKRMGENVLKQYDLFYDDDESISLIAVDENGDDVVMSRNSTTLEIVKQSDATVMWKTTLLSSDSSLGAIVIGSVDYDSYCRYSVELFSNNGAVVQLSDIQLRWKIDDGARLMSGMGTHATAIDDLDWKWSNITGYNSLWMGRKEAGMMVRLRGEEDDWETPVPAGDQEIVPYIPTTWGGVDAKIGACGVTLKKGDDDGMAKAIASSGPRGLKPDDSTTFYFDVVFTPAKPTDFEKHWGNRQVQVGYATEYLTPEETKAMGATVTTLHQGIPGIINGSLVNPYINYPFLDETVELIKNYTEQANALGMAVKYYYTIRELSSHAAEIFALMSLQGEIVTDSPDLIDGGAYKVAQSGYCHDWNCHGGDHYLHQHIITNYTACWQQVLGDGTWDAAVCDQGTSRWFNYYVSGLDYSIRNAPFVNGIYYDGINFDRLSMRRIRKTINKAAKDIDSPFPEPLLDMHTGNSAEFVPSMNYLSHYAYVDSLWNGEGFVWEETKEYYLTEVSGLNWGLSGDTLGCKYPYRAAMFGMVERNSDDNKAVWDFWDSSNIQETTLIGWWEDDAVATVDVVDVEATVFSNFGVNAIVVVASFVAAGGGGGVMMLQMQATCLLSSTGMPWVCLQLMSK